MASALVLVEEPEGEPRSPTSNESRSPLNIRPQTPGSPSRWPPRGLVAGGIRSSVLTLASGALGTGPLALPFAMKSTGLGIGVFLVLLSTSLAALGGDVLIRCAAEQQHHIKISSPRLGNDQLRSLQLAVRSWTYLLEKHFGPRASVFLDVLLAFLGCGIIVMYLVFMAQFLGGFLSNLHITPPSRKILIGACALASFPPSLPGSIGKMRFMAAWIYLVLVLLCVLTSVGLVTCKRPDANIEVVNLSFAGTLRAFCLFFFAQMYHFNLYTIFSGLEPPHEWSPNFALDRSLADIVRMRKIIRFTALATTFICSIISVTGYLSWRIDTNQNIILNYKPDTCGDGTMWLTLALEVMLMVNTLVSIPLNVVPTRVSILRLMGLIASERVVEKLTEFPWRHLLTFILIFSLALIAMVLTGIAEIISFLSGSIGTVIAFLLPFIFYKKSQVDEDARARRFTVLMVLGLATIAGFGNVVAMVVTKITGK